MAQEKQFENRIKRYLTENGIWHVKYFANGFTKSGIPDILACANGKFLAIEVKAENGKPTQLQVYNVEKIREAGGYAMIVKPSQFDELKKLIQELLNENS